MKKLVLVLGLIMGSMLASDAIAAVNYNGTVNVNNNDSKKETKKKKKAKKSCGTEAQGTKKGCSTEHSCCKKKAEAPATGK